MDLEGYKRGAIALGILTVVIVAADWIGNSEDKAKDPIVNLKNLINIPVDDAPGCIAQGVNTAPPIFASAPNPYGIATRHVFDRLVEYDRRTGKYVPGLATRWEVSDDRRSYVFFLRKHVNFHKIPGYTPTRAFNANDVVFTFSRYMVQDNPYFDPKRIGAKDYKTVDMPSLIESISRQDPYKIMINLTAPYPKFISNLTMDFASIQSKEYAETMIKNGTKEQFYKAPVGTGAFAFAGMDGKNPRYSMNPTYWADHISRDAPKILERQFVPQEIIGTD